MRICGLALVLAIACLCGCVSKSKAKLQAQAAFTAGQQETLMRLQQVRGPSITFSGPVRNPFVPWTPDLTLARAIIAAVYFGAQDPSHITLFRHGQQIPVDPGTLLQGEDVPLEAGDIIKIE